MYGKLGNSGENLNGTVHPGGNFPEKSNAFRGIPFFPFLLKRPKFVVPFVWITSARLHVKKKRKLCRYFAIRRQPKPVPVFGAKKKIPEPFDGNFPAKFPCKW